MAGRKRVEVLAPAGDFERLEAAVQYGADAVYLGGKEFGMRASPLNFTEEELLRAVDYCHQRGVRVYVTCNILPREEDLAHLPAYLHFLQDAGVDALIVADIGVMMLCRREIPQMELHMSTQTGVVNHLAAAELYHLGVKRVVLARELGLEEIRRIRKNTPPELELEAFVHGAMCMSFSGRCVLSNYLAGRDANRGECAQPCRWNYHLVEEKRPGSFFPIFEDEDGTYILNAKDLCMIEHLDQLAAAGVSSFKIEGRAKSFYYVATVTNAYRCAADLLEQDPAHYHPPGWLVEETRKVSHRQYCTGFYFGRPEDGQYYESGYIRNYDVAAVVEAYEDGMLFCTQRNRFFPGETLEILSPGQPPRPLEVSAIFDADGQPLDAARHPMQPLRIPCEVPLEPGTILRRRQNETFCSGNSSPQNGFSTEIMDLRR
ncbi:MAG: U32 family peptidase [Oscillospiraceae bacterium]|nr:U32 family peptidase [Oscillospiraceae bacterium]